MKAWRYPELGLYTEKQLASLIAEKGGSFIGTINLIEECRQNKDNYWFDNVEMSKPEDGKWVRTASGTPLGQFQEKVNMVLAEHDSNLPPIIYGGISEKSIKDAASALLGHKKHRILLKIDMRRFFEHISYDDVVDTLTKRCACSERVARVIAEITCVGEGAKNKNDNSKKVIARGFSTSGRLAVWCNLGLFRAIFNLVSRRLKQYDPKIAVYMDDIGITASRVHPSVMASLYRDILKIIKKYKQELEINQDKTVIVDYLGHVYNVADGTLQEGISAPFEFVGVRMERNYLRVGNKTRGKITRLSQKTNLTEKERRSLKGLKRFANYINSKSSN